MKCKWIPSPEANFTAQPKVQEAKIAGKVLMFGGVCKDVAWYGGKMPPVGTKLYTTAPAPAAPLDISGLTAYEVCELSQSNIVYLAADVQALIDAQKGIL